MKKGSQMITYIAGDWDGDKTAIKKLYAWNANGSLSLSFKNAHDLTQAKDDSLNCSIKASLRLRMNGSDRFVLIVGNNTRSCTAGACFLCHSHYNGGVCSLKHSISNLSFIEFECDKAVRDGLDIVVLYNSAVNPPDRSNCPNVLKNIGKHVPMLTLAGGHRDWDYDAVRDALR